MANVGKYTIPWVYGYTVHIFQGLPSPPGNGGDCLGCHCFSCWSCDRLGDGHYMSLPLEKMANGVAGGWEAWEPQLQSFGTRNSNQIPRRHFATYKLPQFW